MTRKSRVFCRVEILESRALLTALTPVAIAHGAPVPVVPLLESSPGSLATFTPTSMQTATVPNVTLTENTLGNNVVAGSYGHAGRSMPIRAEGNVTPLGQVSVTGSITLSGRSAAHALSGVLTLSGAQGSVTLQFGAIRVPGNMRRGPLVVTETVTATTGAGDSLQGESGSGSLVLGHGARTVRDNTGQLVAARNSFWMVVHLNSPD